MPSNRRTTKSDHTNAHLIALTVTALALSVAVGARPIAALAQTAPAPTAAADEDEAFRIAVDAYVYAYPLITMEMTRRVMTNTKEPEGNHAPMGQFAQQKRYPDANFREVTAPNADTLYSTAWLDLSKEPYILHVPDEPNRYYLMPVLSAWTDVFAVPGTRTTGTKAADFAITGPNWKGPLPAGVKEYRSPTNMVWIVGRTYCNGSPADYDAVHTIQSNYALTPLSAFRKPYTPPAGKVDPVVDMRTPPRDQVERMNAPAFFGLFASLLKSNPPAPGDAPLIAKLAKIGIVPGQKFDTTKLDAGRMRGLDRAPAAALEQIKAHEKEAGDQVNGWMVTTKTGQYGTDYLQRALIARVGLGANLPDDAIYPEAKTDGEGSILTGANRYVLHFEREQIPPVNAFWSLTMYDEQYYFVANPLNRYTLSPRNALQYNRDGSVDLYVQNDSPGEGKESNWLPAPKDNFVLMLRLYWPKEPVLSGKWKPAPVREL